MKQVLVREMKSKDIDAVINIYTEVFDEAYVGFGELSLGMGIAPGIPSEAAPSLFREELHSLLCNPSSNGLFVAIHEVEVIGFAVAALHSNDNGAGLECWLNDIGVSQSCQGFGVGKKLVDKVFTWAFQEKGASYCLLESGIKNETAHKFFEHMEFQPISVVFWKGSNDLSNKD
jgi:GNAT superfamily N-acetyltransferase